MATVKATVGLRSAVLGCVFYIYPGNAVWIYSKGLLVMQQSPPPPKINRRIYIMHANLLRLHSFGTSYCTCELLVSVLERQCIKLCQVPNVRTTFKPLVSYLIFNLLPNNRVDYIDEARRLSNVSNREVALPVRGVHQSPSCELTG